jgi:hypothetical protein
VLNKFDGGADDPMVGAGDVTNTINIDVSANSNSYVDPTGSTGQSDAPI